MISRGVKNCPPVVPLLAHLQEQPFIDLGKGEDVGVVVGAEADVVDLVQHIKQIALGVDARAVNARHDLADDLLSGRGVRFVLQVLKVGDEPFVHEIVEGVRRRFGEPLALRGRWCRPVPPAEGLGQRRPEIRPHGPAFLGLDLLSLVEDAQEEDPGQLGHILHGPGAVRATHHIAYAPDRAVDGGAAAFG